MTRPARQARGAAALPLVLVAALVLALVIGWMHAAVVDGQRAGVQRGRAAAAVEAAEAGVAWLLARLNAGTPLDAACRPDPSATHAPPRDVLAGPREARGAWHPPDRPVHCAGDDRAWAWACACGDPPTAAPAPGAVAFSARLLAGPSSDTLRLHALGCSGQVASCAPDDPSADALATVSVSVGHLPALPHAPAAALTVHRTLTVPDAAWSVLLPEATPGTLALHVGAGVHAPRLALRGPPGAPPQSLGLTADAALIGASTGQGALGSAFVSQFHMSPALWRALPSVTVIDCARPCDAALAHAMGPSVHAPLLWLAGGLRLEGPARLGTPQRPVLIVADGPVHLAGPVQIHGHVQVRGDTWHAAAGSEVTGSVVAEGDLHGTGPARFRRDAAVLAALHDQAGTFLRVPGSWKDFE